MSGSSLIVQVSAIAIEGRAVMVEGPPGSGKSSLALALIDRGAMLIGDDGISLSRDGNRIIVSPPPNIAGMLEIRGVGIVELPATQAPLALILSLEQQAPRYPDELACRDILGVAVPVLPLRCGDAIQALRAEWALHSHGLSL